MSDYKRCRDRCAAGSLIVACARIGIDGSARARYPPAKREDRILKQFILAVGIAFALLGPAHAADPQTFKTEESATKFCKAGNVVWFNPASKIYFNPGSQF